MTPKTFGRYEIIKELGRGGMGSVYVAHDPRLGRKVAIKVIHADIFSHHEFRLRFEREAKVMAVLTHPAIVPIYDFGEANGQAYLVMPLMQNGSLGDRLRNGPLSLGETTNLIDRLASAIDMAHQKGIIHRDLKPANILFDQQNSPYITDFGIAKLLENTWKGTQSGAIMGTPAYMSPEQALGENNIDPRSDIYSLGLILFEILTGEKPYKGEGLRILYQHVSEQVPNILDLRPDLPFGCQEIINRAMAKNRKDRYSTAGEMAAALKIVIQGKKVPTAIKEEKASDGWISWIKKGLGLESDEPPPPPPPPLPIVPEDKNPFDTSIPAYPTAIESFSTPAISLTPDEGNTFDDFFIPVTPIPSASLTTEPFIPIVSSASPDPESKRGSSTVIARSAIPTPDWKPNPPNEHLPQVTLISSPPNTRLADQTIISVRTNSLKVFKEKAHLIEALIEGHLKRIRAKLDKTEGTRLFLTGFGSFGGTSLVQATTAKLMENFKKAGKVLVIRFDTSHHTRWGQYQLFINESKVGSISQSVDQKQLLTKIDQILAQRARWNNTPSTMHDFFQGVTGAFAQDPSSSQAVTTLVSQVLKLLNAQHNDSQMSQALDQLLATPSTNQVGQVVLIIDRLEREEAMQRLLNSAISNGPRYPRLSLIVVTPHQAFNRWSQPFRKKIRQPHFIEYYYVRRLWSENLQVEEILKHFMAFDVSVLNEDERHRFDRVFLHLAYKARGSVARVMRELKMGQYFSKEGSKMVIDIDAIYKQGQEEIEHNARVQQILDRSWVQIIGQGLLSRTQTADQAKIGIYEAIEWIRDNHFFDKQELVDAAAKQEIPISHKPPVRKRVLDNLLPVLERNGYLKCGPEADSYELAGLDHPSKEDNQQASQDSPQDATSAAATVIHKTAEPPSSVVAKPTPVPPPTPQPPSPTPIGPLHIALLADKTTKTDKVITLATQIGFEVLEKGYRLVMTDRVGVDATVRERLAPYCAVAQVKGPMLIATSQGVKGKQEGVISVSDSHQQLEEFLKKADVLILAQKDGTTDPLFASDVVKERAKKQGVPVIEPFAHLDATKRFFVPDVAREMVALAKEACARV